ncbi:uncharacterized protein LDX57_001890 [Aspergillus melleus]|uniref:uncharacterized protein n=1 Tax=Aspergillus melleus TaxID=138277 RepID=UPI001E8E4DEA|nr:uncharacterized protein LDX57_001890 [Aspergillus melleus]KAH8424136.1 hypothetical protein LDX57_001890 [Aspergillus melleus]
MSSSLSSSTIHVPLGVLDHFCPPNYTAISWYIPLKDGVTPQEAFAALEDGLRATFKQYPWLSGKVYKQVSTTPGWRPGQLEIRYDSAELDKPLSQFRFKELKEDELPMSYEEIQELGFPMDAFPDEEMLWGNYINVPEEDHGAECLKAQANFFPGALLLCGATHHNVCDGTSQFDVWRAWAANCDALQSPNAPKLADPDPLSSDRELIERILAIEGGTEKKKDEMSPVAWTLLDMDHPDGVQRPPATLRFDERMQSGVFYIPPDKFAALHASCVKEAGADARISSNDAMTALIWRGLLKARRQASLNAGRANDTELADVKARLQLTLDGRPDISRTDAMPLVYLGNLVLMNECVLSLQQLTAQDTSIATVARAIRQVAETATSEAMLDAYALARGMDDLSKLGLRLTPLREYDLILSSLIMFPVEEMRWGGRVFANGGKPDALRPLWDAINTAARLCFPLPRQTGAGTQFVVNLFGDEMELLLQDEEFAQYAIYLCS